MHIPPQPNLLTNVDQTQVFYEIFRYYPLGGIDAVRASHFNHSQSTQGNERRSTPPPLPPRSTRPDYNQSLTIETDESTLVSDTSSIFDIDNDEDADVTRNIAEAGYDADDDNNSGSDHYWSGVEQFDDDALNALLLMFDDISLGPPYDEPATPAKPPTMPMNQVASSSRLPFISFPTPTKWYVVTKGSETGVYDDWLYVAHITQKRGSVQKGYNSKEEALLRYENAVSLGIVQII